MNQKETIRGTLRRHRVEVLLVAVCWVTFACVLHGRPGYNVNSRIAVTFAVVDHGTVAIDAYHDQPLTGTLDKAAFGGHVYSDKSPALSFLAVPFYALVSPFLEGADAVTRIAAARQWCTAWTVGLLGALAAALFHRLMRLFGARGRDALMLTLLLFFGTNLGGYTSLFYAYLPAAACVLAAYVLALSARRQGAVTPVRAVGIGLLVSTAGFLEFTFGLASAVLLLLFSATLRPARSAAGMVAGALPPRAAQLAYNHALFGDLSLGYAHEVQSQFREGMARGVMGVGAPSAAALYYATIHPFKGLFFYSPFLLFFFVGYRRAWREHAAWRPDLVAAGVLLVGYLLFNSSYYMWWGGWAMGARHQIGMLPFLFLPILSALASGSPWRPAVIVAGVVAVSLHLPVLLADPQIPPGAPIAALLEPTFAANWSSPWLTRSLPAFFRGDIAAILPFQSLPGLTALLPLAMLWTLSLRTMWLWEDAD
ncbi:MAG: hypothetical protein ACE5FL_15635 [Myxococcota bacterium]